MTRVTDKKGNRIDYEAAAALMDDDLREHLHTRFVDCNASPTDQVFFNVYAVAHHAKFGEDFAPATGGAW